MKTLRSLVSLLAVVFVATFLHATPAITGNLDLVSGYVFRGEKLADASAQPSVNVTLGDFYANAWATRAVKANGAKEVDLSLGGGFGNVDYGVTAYTYPGQSKTTFEPYVGVAHESGGVKASIYAYRDLTLHTTSFEGKASIVAVGKLSVEGTVGTVLGSTSYTYWGVGPALKAHVLGRDLNLSAQYVSSSGSDFKRGVVVGKVGVSF